MSRERVLSTLLQNEILPPSNLLLLKKLLLCMHHGWLRINGLPPDNQFSLGKYLLDKERIIFDFSRMNEQSKNKFKNWFLNTHQKDARRLLLNGVTTNNYRGFTAEVGLSWWGRIMNFLFYRRKSYYWNLAPLAFSFQYQLTGMAVCEDEQGLLIGLNQFSIKENEEKYESSSSHETKPLMNVKRLYLTDEMVNRITTLNLNDIDFNPIIFNPHPFSIDVSSNHQRMQAMREYRETNRFVIQHPWYIRLWRWFKAKFFKEVTYVEMDELEESKKNYEPIFEDNGVSFFKDQKSGQILVIEKRPELDSFVFCGGGAKIFAHIGGLKAFEEVGIKGANFAGSSSGAIFAILCYLGYSTNEILDFFQEFNQDNLIWFEIDRSGLSGTRAVKAALDYMLCKKINEIIKNFQIDQSVEGKRFLTKEVFKLGKITFESLHLLKQTYPDCGLGRKLIITATNMNQRKTIYCSYLTHPHLEISEAGRASASLPVVFKPTLLDGEIHNDGGILSNFPTEVFQGDLSTFLESEHRNCLSMVAFQFDNGYERGILDKLVKRVYRENFLLNWAYGFITGVKDPVSGWEKDRLKLLHHSNQVVLIPINKITATSFNLDESSKNCLIQNGYQAALAYIQARYETKGDQFKNEEFLYNNFTSIEELLYFCCYRGHLGWFDRLSKEAIKQGVSEEKINQLKENYFGRFAQEEVEKSNDEEVVEETSSVQKVSNLLDKQWFLRNLQLFELIYKCFFEIPLNLFNNAQNLKIFRHARHALNLDHPLAGLKYLKLLKGEQHVLVSIFINILENACLKKTESTCEELNGLIDALKQKSILNQATFYGQWNLNHRQLSRILKIFGDPNPDKISSLCCSLKLGEEPLDEYKVLSPMPESSEFDVEGHILT